jgi:hypothetical protein
MIALQSRHGRQFHTELLKPLTFENVVSSFKQAHLRPTEVQKRCTIFFEGEWKSADVYSYCVIHVENSDEDIQVTFYLTDAHERIGSQNRLTPHFLLEPRPRNCLRC